MMIGTIASIAGGGALGALARYGVGMMAIRLMGAGFPWGTLCVNIGGSFVMGLVVVLFAHFWQPPQTIKLFLITGFLGAFTTFSTFSLDVITLWQRGDMAASAVYALSSCVLSVGALLLALLLVRSFSG